jgi:hypothetical protein
VFLDRLTDLGLNGLLKALLKKTNAPAKLEDISISLNEWSSAAVSLAFSESTRSKDLTDLNELEVKIDCIDLGAALRHAF